MTAHISTALAARALGVGVSTVKRWVDAGDIPAIRTRGGHRKLILDDLLRLIHEGVIPCQDLSLLTGMSGEVSGPDRWTPQLVDLLLRGESGPVVNLMNQVFSHGFSMAELADTVISPAMSRIGHQWESDEIDIFHEHRGTWICYSALQSLRARLRPVSETAPIALGGGPEGDPYCLSNELIELTLHNEGWRVHKLGANTPLASFSKAIEELKPRLIWLSVSHLVNSEQFLDEYDKLYSNAEKAGAVVVIGGQALSSEIRSQMMYTFFGDGLRQLTAFVQHQV